MKQFVIFLLLCVPSMYGQNPLEGKWITNSLLCDFKEEDSNLFVLTQYWCCVDFLFFITTY